MKKAAVAILCVTLVSVLSCLTPPAEAAKKITPGKQESSVFLAPLLGGYSFSNGEQLQPALLYGIKLGYDITGTSIFRSLGIEATYNHFSTRSEKSSASATGNLFRIDATYPFTPQSKWVPFLALGMGGIHISSNSYTDTNPLLNYGAGVKYFYDDYLALRMDARHLIVYDAINTHNNYEVSFGVSYYFDKEKNPKPAPLSDQDQDGVPDTIDKCSNTPKGITVDKNGCPVDSDKDGVPDYLDKCPYSPVGVPVNKDGCPIDERKDDPKPAAALPVEVAPTAAAASIPAAATVQSLQTVTTTVQPIAPAPSAIAGATAAPAVMPAFVPPAPPAAAPAAAQPAPPAPIAPASRTLQPEPAKLQPSPGEPIAKAPPEPLLSSPTKQTVKPKVITELVIEFKFDKFTIRPHYLKRLQEFATFMQSNPDVVATIEGHTDAVGSEAYNLKLSRQRAETVKKSLLGFGAAADRVTTVGYGFSKPVASNETDAGRQQNRRAVTIVTFTGN